MKNILILITALIFLVGCSERTQHQGALIRGCQDSGLSYKSCSCLAERTMDSLEDGNINRYKIEETFSNLDKEILQDCIGKQDPEELIESICTKGGLSRKICSCLAETLIEKFDNDEIETMSTPVFNPKEADRVKMNAIKDKILNIISDKSNLEKCQ